MVFEPPDEFRLPACSLVEAPLVPLVPLIPLVGFGCSFAVDPEAPVLDLLEDLVVENMAEREWFEIVGCLVSVYRSRAVFLRRDWVCGILEEFGMFCWGKCLVCGYVVAFL